MNSQHYPVHQLHLNPDNPRFIRDERYKQLVTSLADNPQLLEARPILCSDRTGKLIVLGGNMRLRAAKELKLSTVPVVVMSGLTYDQEREIVIKDNASFGTWDFDILANDWSDLPLDDWGVDLPADWLEEGEPEPDEPSEPDFISRFEVVVECRGEVDQQSVYNKLQEMGYTCRILSL